LRARAILRSLVPLEDLVGALSLRFSLQPLQRPGDPAKRDMPPGIYNISILDMAWELSQKSIFRRTDWLNQNIIICRAGAESQAEHCPFLGEGLWC